MPRDGSNQYAPPGGTLATPLTPVASAPYNAFVNDIATDQNTPRPIVAGGTGATTAAAARSNLGIAGVVSPSVDNTVPRFNGVAGEMQGSGVTIDDSNNLTVPGGTHTVTKTDNGAVGAKIVTQHISTSPAASDVIADWEVQGKDSGANTDVYGDIQHILLDPTATLEDSAWAFLTRVAGVLVERLRFGAGLYMQGATGGDPGVGKINATEVRQNGAPISPGLCKAWINFNGTGTPAIRAQFNVASITDGGAGIYTINFTNALADANYAVVAIQNSTNTTTVAITGQTTAGFTISISESGTGPVDRSTVMAMVMGN